MNTIATARSAHCLLLLVFSLSTWAAEPSDELDAVAIRTLANQLIAIPHRGMGQPGANLALAVIESRLLAAGLMPVRVRTTVSVAADHGSFLDVGTERQRLIPHQSNQAATSGTEGKTLSGRLVFVGQGTLPELTGKPVAGNIAVLDDGSRDAWTNVAGLGAIAVIFRPGEQLDRFRLAGQSVSASVAFPRFIADLDPSLDGKEATLTSTVVWEPRPAWSLVALVRGTAPGREAVILTAGYEANGAIDGLNPGATRAWNAATLTTIACSLQRQPPERTTVVVFNGGRGEMLRGLRMLTAGMTLDRDGDGLLAQTGDRLASQHLDAQAAATRAHWVGMTLDGLGNGPAHSTIDFQQRLEITITSNGTPAQTTSDQRRLTALLLTQVLATEAGNHADAHLATITKLRDRLPRQPASITDAEDPLRRQLADEQVVYDAWRSVQQRLDYQQPLDHTDHRLLSAILPSTRAMLARHRALLDERVADAASLLAARRALGAINPIHLVALDLSDGNAAFSSVTAGFYVTWSNELVWLHKALLKLATSMPGTAYDPAPQQLPGEAGAWWPENYLHEAAVAGLFLPAVTLSTTNDARHKLGTPLDTANSFRADRFLRQCKGLLPLLKAYIDGPDIANRTPRNRTYQERSIRVEMRCVGSKNGRRPFPFPFSTVAMGSRCDVNGDIRTWETWWGDLDGEARVPFLPDGSPIFGGRGLPVFCYGFDDVGGIREVMAGSDLQFNVQWQVRDVLALVFTSAASRLHNSFDPRLLTTLTAITPLAATRNAPPNFFHVESSNGQSAIFTEPGMPLLVTASQGRTGNRMVLLGQAGEKSGEYRGRQPGNLTALTALDAAEDLWQLDDQRLELLRRNGIDSDSLVGLHALAERHLTSARAARDAGDVATATGEAQSSWALSSRVYPSLLATANDVVHGLVVLLAFAIPFALICERLFLAGATIVRKVIGFSLCFLATFLFFLLFHPAFALATTPMIIFLAFLIILMSGWVIGIIFHRFEHEMEIIRTADRGLHRVDVSRLGTLVTTIALGISNLRRRPLRTALTGLTVMLMTFILLTFASFTPSLTTQRVGLDATPSFAGILLRNSGWLPLAERTLQRVTSSWGRDTKAYPLRWLQPSPHCPRFPLTGPGGSSSVAGVIGIAAGDPTGLERALVRGRLSGHGAGDSPRGLGDGSGGEWLFLPEEVLRRIGVEPGATVTFRGRELKAGVIDDRVLAGVMQLGGESPTPLALDGLDQQRTAVLDAEGSPVLETTSFRHLGSNTVAVLRESLVTGLGLGGTLRGISLVPRTSQTDIAELARDLAQELALTLRVGDRGEAYLLTGVGRVAMAGLGSVLVPLILGGLIIFSTMLNSVAERRREIFIYASLGLAPAHVAALFLVEAGIYAVLGGLGGYMLAQVIVWTLGVAAGFGFGVQPDLNYSSFTAVVTILLVMATVLLSALYPALMAARAANPGTSEIRLPAADGDRMEFDFPFTVAQRDIHGLLAFLVTYLDHHSESSTAGFTTADAALTGDDAHHQISARVWLAPFDLGLSQRFTLMASPTDVKAIYAIRISLVLLSGQRSDWRRANSAFLKDLRHQFLVWRTLTPETMDRYRAQGGDAAAQARIDARLAAVATEAPA